ncbi:MAG TPA: hypothetical protein VGS41_06725, partial [Chthonomonadales bacterium]|nr:hypothetical protein [Chthonomonadales bacterium]
MATDIRTQTRTFTSREFQTKHKSKATFNNSHRNSKSKAVVSRMDRPCHLTPEQILRWCDAFHEQTGEWPRPSSSQTVEGQPFAWTTINTALQKGLRGLPAGSSLPRLLDEHRGVRNRKALPPYTESQILQWMDQHFAHTGTWPTRNSGPVEQAPGETWMAVEVALANGARGLPGGSSIAKLRANRRGVRNKGNLPNLSIEQVLYWADRYHERTGKWP